MRMARKAAAVVLSSLVAWFGVAAAAPLHAHPVDGSQSLFLHMLADDAHSEHGGHAVINASFDHDREPADDGAPSGGAPSREPILHSHSCSHAVTLSESVRIPDAILVAMAAWLQSDTSVCSFGAPPPRKPPRFLP
jgi:hypothetical protein